MTRRLTAIVAGFALLGSVRAQADELECIQARYQAAGKYTACEAKVAAKTGDDLEFLKCRQRYADVWSRLQKKYPDTSCGLPRFVDNGLTITDNLTRLVWEKKTTAVGSGMNASDRHDVDNLYSWSGYYANADGTAFSDFLDDLNSTGYAGQRDWRLPTRFELHTIVSTDAVPCGARPCVADSLFSPMQSANYWSSSESPADPAFARYVEFYSGDTYRFNKTDMYYVRAVRGGL